MGLFHTKHAAMKNELCIFSGGKIYPGHGKLYTRIDGKSFHFLNSKAQSLFVQRKNPRKIAWTVLYRRKHRKGIATEDKKRKTRKTAKFVRGIEGVTNDKLKELRSQKAEFRTAQRQQDVRAAKEKVKAKNSAKKSSGGKRAAPKGG